MLRKETIEPGTLDLLRKLMQDKHLSDFFLVGGTALSLLIGHRTSIDIDLFSVTSFDEKKLLEYLEEKRGMQLNYLDNNTIKGEINRVQVDLITHAYPLVKNLKTIDGIRVASIQDISAMKLNAIVGNGTRLKDFIDIAFLSSFLSLDQMLDAYETKYKTRNAMMVLKSLDFHQDINHLEPINLVTGPYSWKPFEQRIKLMLAVHDQILEPLAKGL
ncbi:MAG TPA: nucleotidyl transferase AbiEii/AbiGii toxin family protein [Hanamia sp.]|nr:nucleotidyl transferase AbiEii/AbiGii toxin family protein [Hanamia sp.]